MATLLVFRTQSWVRGYAERSHVENDDNTYVKRFRCQAIQVKGHGKILDVIVLLLVAAVAGNAVNRG